MVVMVAFDSNPSASIALQRVGYIGVGGNIAVASYMTDRALGRVETRLVWKSRHQPWTGGIANAASNGKKQRDNHTSNCITGTVLVLGKRRFKGFWVPEYALVAIHIPTPLPLSLHGMQRS